MPEGLYSVLTPTWRRNARWKFPKIPLLPPLKQRE
jgi:hypothetical protein